MKTYRAGTTRLRDWNYSSAGWYFITFCVDQRRQILSSIQEDGTVKLSKLGEICLDQIYETEIIRPNIGIDSFIIMPDHIHLIVEIFDWSIENKTQKTLQADSIGSMIGQLKGAMTKRIRAFGLTDFTWQKRFYDRIIKDEKNLNTVRIYIEENPIKWLQKPDHHDDL